MPGPPVAKWELVAWLVVVAVFLIVVHALLQFRLDRANDSQVTTLPTTTKHCAIAGRSWRCAPPPAAGRR